LTGRIDLGILKVIKKPPDYATIQEGASPA